MMLWLNTLLPISVRLRPWYLCYAMRCYDYNLLFTEPWFTFPFHCITPISLSNEPIY
jgi:hypothetical protein